MSNTVKNCRDCRRPFLGDGPYCSTSCKLSHDTQVRLERSYRNLATDQAKRAHEWAKQERLAGRL